MVSRPMQNSVTGVMTATAAAAIIYSHEATRKQQKNKFSPPMKNAAVCADWSASSGSRVKPLAAGSKKETTLPDLSTTLIAPDEQDPAGSVLELDEVWSFVRQKSRKRWIWIALMRSTRQVVAYVVGDRSQATCQKLWERIPESYRRSHCYSDFWEAYAKVLPATQHTAGGKESGETAHVERWNKRVRTSAGRASSERLYRSPSQIRCTRYVYDYSFIATISHCAPPDFSTTEKLSRGEEKFDKRKTIIRCVCRGIC